MGRGHGADGLETRAEHGTDSAWREHLAAAPLGCSSPATLELPSGIGKNGGGIGSGDGPIEQIVPTTAESQRIVAARPLCRLQYRVESKSSAWDLPQ